MVRRSMTMKISWRMILGLSIGLTAWTGCGDSDADNPLDKHTSNLVQTWNSPDGETRVLAGDSPASIVDDALTNEERSEEHTSELQSRGHLVCRLLLEKKKKITVISQNTHIYLHLSISHT